MTTPAIPAAAAPAAAPLNEEAVFSALGNGKRRRLLTALMDGEGKAASQLTHLAGSHDAAMKHLTELREAGLVQMAKDPADNRRQRYTLTPAVQVIRHEQGLDLDFGCGVWRVRL